MKNMTTWIVLSLLLAAGAVPWVHWNELQEPDRKLAAIRPLHARQGIIDRLTLDLEKYRRMSSQFRKMLPQEIVATKERLRSGFSKSLAELRKLEPDSTDQELSSRLDRQLADFLAASAKVEPRLFLKDAYLEPEIAQMHEGMTRTLASLGTSASARFDALNQSFNGGGDKSLRLIKGLSGLIGLLVAFLLLRMQLRYARPLKKLHGYASALRASDRAEVRPPGLKRTHGEIESALGELSRTVESQRKDRHKFVADVVEDLRTPLGLLQKGRALGSGRNDEASELDAAGSVRRGLALLSGSLEDLDDILNLNRLDSRLEEQVVDLTELVSDTARTLSGATLGKSITVSAPPMPVWVLLDARRFERVLVQLLSRAATVASARSTPSRLQLTITQPPEGRGGVEVLIQEANQGGSKARLPGSAPEQDLTRHWIAEKGLGMTLVHKTVRAHGGSIFASGIAGSSLQFRLLLPRDRVGNGLVLPTGANNAERVSPSQKIGLEIAPLTHANLEQTDLPQVERSVDLAGPPRRG